ncbi:MAG: hypothetical protein GC136_08000 [Alphaproteobacteria bacterium]|nr:hypothetical protein [Alphaproteobacteria bacterium]
MKVKFLSSSPQWPWRRQLPDGKSLHGVEFLFGDETDFDWLVIYDGIQVPYSCKVSPARTIIVTGEPPNVKIHAQKFIDQFGVLLTPHNLYKHKGKIVTNTALPWLLDASYGADGVAREFLDIAQLQEKSVPKTKMLSVICSNKTTTPEHRLRLAFVEKLKEHFGDRLDVYGRGFRDMEDKGEAIWPYRYHIALENSVYDHYWTEKLSDTFIARCCPFYAGCKNIFDYFPQNSLMPISMTDPPAAIELIEKALQDDVAANAQEALVGAREKVFEDYNIFAVLAKIVKERGAADSAKQDITILPEATFQKNGFTRIILNGVEKALPGFKAAVKNIITQKLKKRI